MRLRFSADASAYTERQPACFCAGMQQHTAVQEAKRDNSSENARPPEGTRANAFGIKHLSDAEWAEHEGKRKAQFDQRHVLLCHNMPCGCSTILFCHIHTADLFWVVPSCQVKQGFMLCVIAFGALQACKSWPWP